MSCALIVSTSEKGKSFFADLIKTVGISNIVTVGNGSEARRILNRTEFDLVVINAPLSDEFGHELSISISKLQCRGFISSKKRHCRCHFV